MSDAFYHKFLTQYSDAQVTHNPERPRASAMRTPSLQRTELRYCARPEWGTQSGVAVYACLLDMLVLKRIAVKRQNLARSPLSHPSSFPPSPACLPACFPSSPSFLPPLLSFVRLTLLSQFLRLVQTGLELPAILLPWFIKS